MRTKTNAQQCQLAYQRGQIARAAGLKKHANPHGLAEAHLRRWWLAGFVDVGAEQLRHAESRYT